MLYYAWFLARADLRNMFRSREMWLWAFVMPVVFFYFIGTIAGNSDSPAAEPGPIVVVAAPDAGFLADALTRRLGAYGRRVAGPDVPPQSAAYHRLFIPEGFTRAVLNGKPARITVEQSSAGIAAGYDFMRIHSAVRGLLADLNAVNKNGVTPTLDRLARIQSRPKLLAIEVQHPERSREPPSGFQQSIPGMTVMFILLVLFTTGGVSLVAERNQGVLRRLASSPMPRAAVVLGKWGACTMLGSIQVAFAILTGSLLFRIRWGTDFFAVVLVLLSYSAMSAVFGLLLGNLGRTEAQVIGVGVLVSSAMAAAGGCWWPVEISPQWAQTLALILPTGWAMDALHRLIDFGQPLYAVLPHLAAIIITASLAGWWIARSFRFE
jgi:ABC-2 type transport system permease protein